MVPTVKTDACVIGAGVSGLATAKCLQDAGFSVVVLEQSDRVGGLWAFRERGYGVMRFTHINVSKYNYCFSDYPFPDDVADFPHHTDMASYINDYTTHFGLDKIIQLRMRVISLDRQGEEWNIRAASVEGDKNGEEILGEQEIITAKYVAIATGHHATPNQPTFPGQESFKGEIIHSVSYKDAITNGIVGRRVLVVGIGNSAVDVAVDAAATGRSKAVYISSRSGAWIIPNYIFGLPTDLYACRALLWLPWQITSQIFETIISLLMGNPRKYNLNPKMRIMQTQPTVSPTLIHHIQRGHIKVKPNIAKIEDKTVHFTDGTSAEVDKIILSTGYHIRIPYLSDELRSTVIDDSSNMVKLFKNVFSPAIGPSLAFIGFVQPASGGILSMSETQARWFAELCKGRVKLPGQKVMMASMQEETEAVRKRYVPSARHTLQRDPIPYNDDLAARFGAKPQLWRHPGLMWRLLVGSGGAAQWRLNGPGKWDGAPDVVRNVPVTGEIIHSVSYKDAITNGIVGRRVLVVGIGNSAVDVAVDAAATGRSKAVYISSRSGAWIIPNYIFGLPTDLYACRALLWLPWQITSQIFETIISLLMGNPRKYNLNPKMRIMQTQPTVSPTLIHHIQRGHIKVKPNIAKIEDKTVHFTDGTSAEVDKIILSTGYHIRIPYLSDELRSTVIDDSSNMVKLFKNVFSPAIGPSLAFIGFVQPASGGILSMSETQARWFAELCKGRVKLPGQKVMMASMQEETEAVRKRYVPSARHTLQRDPIPYNDDLAARFGAKPQLWRHPGLMWRLLVGSGGAAQWRLNGPGKWDGAPDVVRNVPVTGMMHYGILATIGLVAGLLLCIFSLII